MATKPRTLGLCHKLIEMLEHRLAVAVAEKERHGKLCDAALMEKDKQMVEKCETCGRRRYK